MGKKIESSKLEKNKARPKEIKKDRELKFELTTLVSLDESINKPRLKKLIISNFRSITHPVVVELDEIVVLVGENNSGKSSILKAYEVIMSQGSSKANLTIEDFPNAVLCEKNYPIIELETVVYDNTPGVKWIDNSSGENVVRERWTWKQPGAPVREGYDVSTNSWDTSVPWGAPNVANSRRPIPHRVDAFADPLVQSKLVTSLLMNVLLEKVKEGKDLKNGEEKSNYQKLIDTVSTLQKDIFKDAQKEIEEIESGVSKIVSSLFPNYKIEFDANLESDVEECVSLFKAGGVLKMGPLEGFKSNVEKHGSGAQRTLLWSALKYIEENGLKNKKATPVRPHVLLMDEPELCLHPNAVRGACEVLYNLPQTNNWQVMVTTHSPVFINLAKDNTTIVRVSKNMSGLVQGVTLYRPSEIKLSLEEKKELQMLNLLDPHLSEFFFSSKNIIVEGDTEYTAFKYLIDKHPDKFTGVHIIRARGKAPIVSIAKILNKFSAQYSILHDSDTPLLESGSKNSAWSLNQSILDAVNTAETASHVRLVASKKNFESAFLEEQIKNNKPYNALMNLQSNDQETYDNILKLLEGLTDFSIDLPDGAIEWRCIKELEKCLG